MTAAKDQITIKQLLVPLAIISLTMTLLFAFQMTQITRDREALEKTLQQQEEPLAQSQKLNSQFGGLVVGTRQLAQEGNPSAKNLVEQLKQIGVIPAEQPQAAPAGFAPVPAAQAPSQPGPVKP